jgi:hypothetical protein
MNALSIRRSAGVGRRHPGRSFTRVRNAREPHCCIRRPLLQMRISRAGLLSDLIQTDQFEREISELVEDAVELGRVDDIGR